MKLLLFVLVIANFTIAQTVVIGKQIWMSKNLNISTFRNGDPIYHAVTEEDWIRAGELGIPAWCYPDNNPNSGNLYGKLYNYYAVQDPRGLAPIGYHISTEQDWKELEIFLGEDVAGTKIKCSTGWKLNGENSTGFCALPSGSRQGGTFIDTGLKGRWWIYYPSQSTPQKGCYLRARGLITEYNGYIDIVIGHCFEDGLSVRCLKD